MLTYRIIYKHESIPNAGTDILQCLSGRLLGLIDRININVGLSPSKKKFLFASMKVL